MRITLQIVECHPQQRIPCIVLAIDSQKYFFNAPESFQRFFKEHFVRFAKGSKIFISQLSIDHTGGLFGLILTLHEQGLAENTQIYGPPGLSPYLISTRFLMGRHMIPYSIYDFFNNNQKLLGIKSGAFMEELHSRSDYGKIFLRLNEFLSEEQKRRPEVVNDAQTFVRDQTYYKDEFLEIHPVLLSTNQMSKSSKPSLCYILKPNKIPGKVNSEKLKAFKIPSKDIKKLLETGEIEIDGVIYKAEEFKEPDCPSPVVLIIDCPTLFHLKSLMSDTKIRNLFADKINEKEEQLKAVIHIIPSDVLLDPLYTEFLKNLPESCQHIFLNEQIKSEEIQLKTSKENQEKQKKSKGQEGTIMDLKQLKYRHFLMTNVFSRYFPDHFPILDDLRSEPKYDLNDLFPFLPKKTTYQKMMELVLAPTKSEGFSVVNFSLDKVKQFINFTESQMFQKYYKKWILKNKEPGKTDKEIQTMFKNSDPELLFLGTQSMMPSLSCNVSGIYLRFWQQDNVGFLLDCGEGSYIQLLNHYGIKRTRELIKNIGVIYITHIHADHHLGLLQLIRERDRILEEERQQRDPLFLVLPFNCGVWVSRFSEMVDQLNFKLIFCQHIKIETAQTLPTHNLQQNINNKPPSNQEIEEVKIDGSNEGFQNLVEKEYEHYEAEDMDRYVSDHESESKNNIPIFEEFLFKKLGIIKFRSVDVDHCPQAFGVHIEHKDGWRFLYSGDTRPCDTMVQEVGNTTILVHEATFGDDLRNHAVEKKHSTDREAIEIGMKLRAWRTILTHFSQRYATTSNIIKPEANKKIKDELYYYSKNNVVNATDHFRSKFSQLENMPILSKCIVNMFDDL